MAAKQLGEYPALLCAGLLKFALCDEGPGELRLLLTGVVEGSRQVVFTLLHDLVELLLADNCEVVKGETVSFSILAACPEIKVQDALAELVDEVEVGYHHEVEGVEMCWLPFDVAVVLPSQYVFLVFVVEDDSVVVVRQALDVLAEHELHGIVLRTCQSEEVFHQDADRGILALGILLD